MPGPLRIILKSIVGLAGLLFITIMVALLLGISLNLNAMREPLATAAGSALGREFIIEGNVNLEVSFTPKFDVSDVRLSNPDGFDDSPFATLDELQLQVRALPLLLGELHVISFSAEGVELNLESDAQGNGNWVITQQKDDTQVGNRTSTDADSSMGKDGKDIAFEVKEMTLKSVVVNYTDRALDKKIAFELGQLSGALGAKTPVQIETEGSLQNVPFSLAIDAPSLVELSNRATISTVGIDGEISSTPVSFIAELGHQSGEPSLGFKTEFASIDVGRIIAWFGIAEGLHVVTEKLSIDASLVGDSLKDILEKSMLTATLSAGEALVGQGTGKRQLAIGVDSINFAIEPDKPVRLDLTGKVDQHALTVKAESGKLIHYFESADAVPAHLDITFADATLSMDSELTLPITQGAIDLTLQVEGEKLSTFNKTFYLDLPSLGPYSLGGEFHLEPEQLSLKEMEIAVGNSQLEGTLMVDKSGNKPRIDLGLHSPLLQINDFNLQGWSPEKQAIPDEKKKTESEKQGQTEARVRSVLSAEVLNSFDASVDIRIDQVRSGGDKLGAGKMKLTVENGQLRIEPLDLSVPGGSVNLGFRYKPVKENVDLHLKAKVSRFDYGILARRIKPDSPMDGKLFLDIGLDAVAKDLHGLLKTGKGHFDFALLPGNFDATVFDLWAVNLLDSVSKKMDDEPKSVLNCMLARFRLQDGVMKDQLIFMDTTRMSIDGEATIDFNKERITLEASPEAKKPEYFSLAVPVKVSGSFEDWRLKIGAIRTLVAGTSFITSPVHVTLKRLLSSGENALEGEAACREAWKKSEELLQEKKQEGNEKKSPPQEEDTGFQVH
jgi:uncharacterized protein involved in outer membrane biogenesis